LICSKRKDDLTDLVKPIPCGGESELNLKKLQVKLKPGGKIIFEIT
jgi:hypothetical protein